MNSYWIDSTKNKTVNNRIDDNYKADVCVIGAGITGLSTAYYLAKNGLKVIVVDKSEIGQKTSGHTTAKITLQHGLIYDYLIKSFGFEYAKKYLESNKKAISNIKNIIDLENIDCDFEYTDNYIYVKNENFSTGDNTDIQENLTKIHNEIKAMNSLSEDNLAEFTTDCDLPFKIAGAIKTSNQAQFHPRKYMLGLANAIQNYGGLIFTDSLVNDIEKYEDGYITYVEQYTVKSKYVVLASHYPFINFPGFYFSKMYQSTSYAIAIETDKKIPDGMYINMGEPVLSFRTIFTHVSDVNLEKVLKLNNESENISQINDKTSKTIHQYDNQNMNLLIISGGGHKTGYSPDSSENYGYKYLENKAKQYYPDCKVLYKWDTRDCITLDKIPYIGEFSMFMPNVYVATGFNKWGMTSSNVAANIISAKILSTEKKELKEDMKKFLDYSDVYNSSRFAPIKNRGEMKNMLTQVFHSFVTNRIKIPDKDLSAIKNDNGGIIKINGMAVGIYKNKDGEIFAVDPTCTHLGCLLTWNNVDKTWDCPCHGSRFDYHGKNLYDPAFKDLDTYGLE